MPSAAGKITVQMVRGGRMVIDQTPGDYDYNAYVGAATASSGGPASTSTTTTSTTTSTSCYDDLTATRVIYDGVSTSETSNTISKSLTTCVNQGGVEYGEKGYCGSVIRSGVSAGSDSQYGAQWQCEREMP
ncbi:hypothetical protein EST38_g6816 [Candolleomyces aberdarensis]|uniref:Uncharacterized protein n=1 Tax=Candolleomyces aberdarensis TaxID=2316362 RepID=A0A4Q2DIS4_9AGAR|nr:hypothetical protein EST38_g6816 [Candolleomyces aberdarensis]